VGNSLEVVIRSQEGLILPPGPVVVKGNIYTCKAPMEAGF
jgi:hypothetical protein